MGFLRKILLLFLLSCVISYLIALYSSYKMSKIAEARDLYIVDFEVFGKVQGVFFRKHTEKQAKLLNLRGWCMNSARGTVRGQVEGNRANLVKMRDWLQFKGSPKSRIEKAIFSELRPASLRSFTEFAIRH